MVKKMLSAALILFGIVVAQMVDECFADAAAQLEQAEQYMAGGNYPEAETIYKALVAADPNSDAAFAAQEGLAVLYVLWGKQAEADTAYQELLARYSARAGIAKAVDHVADAHRERGNFQKARQCGEYIADHWPDADHAAEAQAGVVRASILMGDEIGAQAAMNKLLTSFANSTHIAKAVDDVAKEYREAGQYENARQWHQYVVDHWPQDEHALDAQGDVVRCSILLGDEAGAQAAIDKLLADFGGHEKAAEEVVQLANLCQERRDYIKAGYLYQSVVTNWTTTDRAVSAQGRVAACCILLGDETGAQTAYDKLLADFGGRPNVAQAVDHVANAYRAMRNYAKAKQLYEHIATTWPTAKDAVRTQSDLIRCSIGLGDEGGAQAAYDDMLAAFSNDSRLPESMLLVAETYIRRGVELENSTDLVGAQQCYRNGLVVLDKILNDFPTSYAPDVCCWAGTAYFQLEDYPNSLTHFQKVAEEYPEFENAWQAQFMIGRNYVGMVSSGLLPAAEAMPLIKATFEKLVAQYPTCPSAGYAQNWLNRYNSR